MNDDVNRMVLIYGWFTVPRLSTAQHSIREREIFPQILSHKVFTLNLNLSFFYRFSRRRSARKAASYSFPNRYSKVPQRSKGSSYNTMQGINCCRIAIDEEIRSRCVALSTKNMKEWEHFLLLIFPRKLNLFVM